MAKRALENVEIQKMKFSELINWARKGDFVYFDPPYHPVSPTSNFTSYSEEEFGVCQQIELYEMARELTLKEVFVMLSNSSTNFITNLFHHKDFFLHEVKASRSINSNPEKRGSVTEIVITNYSVDGKD